MRNAECHPERPIKALGLCASCYTAQRRTEQLAHAREKGQDLKALLITELRGGCNKCGYSLNPVALRFTATPNFDLNLTKNLLRPWGEVLEEAKHSSVLCLNCQAVAKVRPKAAPKPTEEIVECAYCGGKFIRKARSRTVYCPGKKCAGNAYQARYKARLAGMEYEGGVYMV